MEARICGKVFVKEIFPWRPSRELGARTGNWRKPDKCLSSGRRRQRVGPSLRLEGVPGELGLSCPKEARLSSAPPDSHRFWLCQCGQMALPS